MATRADKKHTVADSGLNGFLERLKTLRHTSGDVPAGWFSVRQMMEQTGLSRSQVTKLITVRIGSGVEMQVLKINTPFGLKHVPHYRLDESARR